jgi:hypothetical protein
MEVAQRHYTQHRESFWQSLMSSPSLHPRLAFPFPLEHGEGAPPLSSSSCGEDLATWSLSTHSKESQMAIPVASQVCPIL